ncbi:hypothetical protein [Bifidobacterium moukalabense]|uniref:hypothetical protein n=1 Tax=Bifidobacterium moukalabense TaxID=1333651 RepID=UPI001F392AE7|nr:hypothetical protein [Bifidobacterium moukalabense]
MSLHFEAHQHLRVQGTPSVSAFRDHIRIGEDVFLFWETAGFRQMELVSLTKLAEILPQCFGVFLVSLLVSRVAGVRSPAGIHAKLGTSYVPDGILPDVKETALPVADHPAQTTDLVGHERVHRIQDQCSDRTAFLP